jgi:hypothetical protein
LQHGYALVYATNSSKANTVLLTEFDQGKNVADSSFDYTFAMWRIFQTVHSLGHDKLNPVRDEDGSMFDVSDIVYR